MSDRKGGTRGRLVENGDESGRIRAEYLGVLSGRCVYHGVMALHPLRALALAVVLVGVVATPLAAGGTAATANATDPAPGAHLAGLVGTQDSEVRGTVAAGTFEARLANASSDRERAAVIDDRLTGTEQRLAALEARMQALDRARENGSIDADEHAARLATRGATADRLASAATASERAAADLPPERRAALNASERAAAIRTRAADVREHAGAATDSIDGTDGEARADPVSVADVRAVARETIRVPGSFQGVAGSERVNLHVRRANGSVAAFAVVVEDGRVVSVAGEPFETPTLAVYTDYRVVRDVQRAGDPAATVEEAIENDRIRYDGQGLGNSLKYGLVRLASIAWK